MIFNPKTPTERLLWAFQFGHRWNPAFPNLQNLDEAAVAKMDGSEVDAKSLIASWQLLDANVNRLVNAFHGRELQPDGDIGPASAAVMDMKRCAMPDYAPPPHASFFYEDENLQKAVESYQRCAEARAAAAFTGSYWRGCNPARPDIHSLKIGIDTRSAPPNFLANQAKILEARRACAAEIGVAVEFVINPQSLDGLQQYQVYRGIPGSVIGMNYFPTANSCGRIPNGSMDTGYDPSDFRLHANLGCHESEGHGFGLDHTNGGVMNPSILLVWPLTWKGDPSWNAVKRYYGGEPIPPVNPPPGPPQPPGTDKYWIKLPAPAEMRMTDAAGKDTILGKFIFVPY